MAVKALKPDGSSCQNLYILICLLLFYQLSKIVRSIFLIICENKVILRMGEAGFWCKPKILILGKNLSLSLLYLGRY